MKTFKDCPYCYKTKEIPLDPGDYADGNSKVVQCKNCSARFNLIAYSTIKFDVEEIEGEFEKSEDYLRCKK